MTRCRIAPSRASAGSASCNDSAFSMKESKDLRESAPGMPLCVCLLYAIWAVAASDSSAVSANSRRSSSILRPLRFAWTMRSLAHDLSSIIS